MNVGIIGCGLIGKKRGKAIQSFPDDHIKVVCDIDIDRAKKLAQQYKCEYEENWEKVVARVDVQLIVNASINAVLEPITVAALKNGNHILCEKPLGRNVKEAKNMVDAALQYNKILKTGFNHRFHPAVWKAKELVNEGKIGRPLIIRVRYGHGSRPGMEKEWRASKEHCGGGELLDQGVHVIDLIRWFGGEIKEVSGIVETKFWEIEVEDNAFSMLKTNQDVTASFHVSWTNWRNVFSFEVFGDEGYLAISGLGGSYGPETLEWGRRKKEGGRPDIKVFDFPPEDISWEREWAEFRSAVNEKREPIGSGYDGLKANQVIESIYLSSRAQKVIKL